MKENKMKNQNIVFIAIVFALAFALAPTTQAAPNPGGIPSPTSAAATPLPGPENIELPVVSIHSSGTVVLGKTASFVLDMKPAILFAVMYLICPASGPSFTGIVC